MLHSIGRLSNRSAAECKDVHWDVIIVGTGMGGATVGLTLARAGKRVLFIEKGLDHDDSETAAIRDCVAEADPAYGSRHDASILARSGRATEVIEDGETQKPFLPEVGSGTGGSSSIFGMVLERFFPEDFSPRRHHKDAEASSLPDTWPVSYEEFEPWYHEAERLYRVKGDEDPLRPRRGTLDRPPPLGPAAMALFDRIGSTGLRPYRLPLACDFVADCRSCQGYLCARECKNDANRIALRPAVREHGAVLLAGCRVIALLADGARVTAVRCQHEGLEVILTSRVVILAGGALETPRLLLSSRSGIWEKGVANRSGLVGKNLMRHGIDLWGLLGAPRVTDLRDIKTLGFNDLYMGTGGGKLGTVQSFGAWPPMEIVIGQRLPFFRFLRPFISPVWPLLSSIPVLASILEDLPYESNRIEVGPDSQAPIKLHYRQGRNEARRRRELQTALREKLKGLRPVLLSGADAPKALGHACGTCRFGSDPKASVLDRNNKAHDLDNLYVVDASFFPSSAGINPSLTIAANALRVGSHLVSRL